MIIAFVTYIYLVLIDLIVVYFAVSPKKSLLTLDDQDT